MKKLKMVEKMRTKQTNDVSYIQFKIRFTLLQTLQFCGDVEINYMKVVLNPEVKALFDDFGTCSSEQFINYLKILQPGKEWTPKKERCRFKNDEPIRGI